MPADTEDRELLARVVYEEYERMPIADRHRPGCHWVMDAEMFRFVRDLRDSWGTPLVFPTIGMVASMDAPMTLLGLPVEIHDGTRGVHLEVTR